jgi:Domain of unknown function (DUF4232)
MSNVKGLFSMRRAVIGVASALALGVGAVAWATSPASAAVKSPAAVKSTAVARCATSALSVWVDASQGSGGAGTIESALEFTNIGSKPCTLIGYPGVAATSATGKQLGDSAGWNPLYPARLVTVPAGGTAHADLYWSDGEVFTSGCKPTQASLIKVYPPNSSTAKSGFFDLPVCTLANHHYLSATVIRSGPRADA